MMFEIGMGLLALGVILYVVGSIGFLIAGFKSSLWWGLGMLFIGGPVGIAFFFTNFDKAWRTVVASTAGLIMAFASFVVAPQDPEINAKVVKYFPNVEEGTFDAAAIPTLPELVEMAKNAKSNGFPPALEDGAAIDEEENSVDARKKFKVFSFDPSQPLDPSQVKISVAQRAKSTSTDAPAPSHAAVVVPPKKSMNEILMGKPQEAVSDELGKPLGIGSKKGQVYWMYTDYIVTFNAARRVESVDMDATN
jgi:hypothetical protein